MAFMEFHEFVCVTGIAVAAGELAAPVGVDGPRERQTGPGPVQHAAAVNFKVADGAFGFQYFALSGEARDSGQTRQGRIAEQHSRIFAFYSPIVKPVPAAWLPHEKASTPTTSRIVSETL